MSAGLLRRGLELLNSDSSGNDLSGLKKRPRGNNPQASLSSNKTGMKKQRRRLMQQGQPQNQRASAKKRVIVSAMDEYKKRAAQDHLAKNLKYFLHLQTIKKKASCKKILAYNYGRKAKDQRVKKQKKVEAKSMFTEKDFNRFQKEYFGSR